MVVGDCGCGCRCPRLRLPPRCPRPRTHLHRVIAITPSLPSRLRRHHVVTVLTLWLTRVQLALLARTQLFTLFHVKIITRARRAWRWSPFCAQSSEPPKNYTTAGQAIVTFGRLSPCSFLTSRRHHGHVPYHRYIMTMITTSLIIHLHGHTTTTSSSPLARTQHCLRRH